MLRGAENVILGRSEEQSLIRGALREMRAGAKRAVLLAGPAGVGKTALLEWAQEAFSPEERAIFFRAPLASTPPPGFPVRQLVDAFLNGNAEQANGVRETAVDGVPDPLSVIDTLNAASRGHAIGILIDDIQWIPREGLALLLSTLRLCDGPLLFVATQRTSHQGDGALIHSSADLPLDLIELTGLAAGDIAVLARELLGAPILPSLAEELQRQTLGNPLFLLETIRSLVARDATERIPGGYVGIKEERSARLSRSIDEAITARLLEVPDGDLAVLAGLAVVGRDCRFEDIRDLLGSTADELVESIERLGRAGLVEWDGPPHRKLRLAHPLYREGTLSVIGPARTAWWHQKVFRSLVARRSTDTREIAYHAVRCLEPPQNLAEVLHAAAEGAVRARSYREAAGWFELLAQQRDLDDEGLVAALEGHAESLEHFQPAEAVSLYGQALERPLSDEHKVRLLIGRASAYRRAGRVDDALEDLQVAEQIADRPARFRIRDARAVALAITGDVDSAERILTELVADSSNADEYSRAAGHLALAVYSHGDLHEATKILRSALDACPDPDYAMYMRMNIGWVLCLTGEWDEAEKLLSNGIQEAKRAGDTWVLSSYMASAARLAAWQGDLSRALDYGVFVGHLAETLPNPADKIGALDCLGGVLIEHGSFEDAIEVLSGLWELKDQTTELYDMPSGMLSLGEAHVKLRQFAQADEALQEAKRHVWSNASWTPATDRLAAEIELGRGDAPAALAALKPWLEIPTSFAFEQARIHEVCAHACAHAGQKREALAQARLAHERYEGLGAALRAMNMKAWMDERIGARLGRPRATEEGELTPREREILRLIGEGKTNREVAQTLIISPGTVKKHVENMKSKLGVSRRTELAAYAVRSY